MINDLNIINIDKKSEQDNSNKIKKEVGLN
jgi:hypothetical protein